MVRLVYQTELFGALHLEYNQPLVRVGSSRDNDLVLLHPSVAPHHCSLFLDRESVLFLPPDFELPTAGLPSDLEAPRYSEGDTLPIGEVQLLVEHSPNTVALPSSYGQDRGAVAGKTHDGFWKADAEEVPPQARWLCPACRIRLEDSQITRIGLEHARKHFLCPKCSHELQFLHRHAAAPTGFFAKLDALRRRGLRWLGIRARRR